MLELMKTIPYKHQLKEFEISKDLEARALLWQMRSGKSKLAIDTACHQFANGDIDGVIIIAPNGVHANWGLREIPIHAWDSIEHDTFIWQTTIIHLKKEVKENYKNTIKNFVLQKDPNKMKWFLINQESLRLKKSKQIIGKFILKACPNFMLVIDESHHFGKPGAHRTKTCRALSNKAKTKRILTGTVVDNNPLRAFSQFELLKKGALGFTRYDEFEENFAEYQLKKTRGGRSYPVLKNFKNLGDLRNRMAKYSSVVLRDDCPDLPRLIALDVFFEMSPEHQKIYDAMAKAYEVETKDFKVTVKEAGAKQIKLQQISSGFLIDNRKETHFFTGLCVREKTFFEVLDSIDPDHQVVVWAHFTAELKRLAELLTERGISFVKYYKGVSHNDKIQNVIKFRSGKPRVMLGQPASLGEGQDLSTADSMIYYSRNSNAIIMGQSEERASAIGKKYVDIYRLVCRFSVDQRISLCLKNKFEMADMIAKHGLKWLLEVLE